MASRRVIGVKSGANPLRISAIATPVSMSA
jgi:hypothetical protein